MSGLKRVQDVYSSDRERANKSMQYFIDFINQNRKWLARVDPKGTHAKFMDDLPNVELLKDWERNRIEHIYELVMKGWGAEAVNMHVDRKRKGVNYGHQ